MVIKCKVSAQFSGNKVGTNQKIPLRKFFSYMKKDNCVRSVDSRQPSSCSMRNLTGPVEL